MEDIRNDVSTEIRVIMARRRCNQTRLAKVLGRSQPYISRRMNGGEPWDIDDLSAMAEYFDVPITAFFPRGDGEAMDSGREPVAPGQGMFHLAA